MKPVLAIIVLCSMLFPIFARAQEKPASKLRMALRAGAYFSSFNVHSNADASYTGDAMIYAGVQVQIPVANKLYICPEVLYSAASVTYHDNSLGGTILASDDIAHILIPVQLKYQVGKLGLYAGLQTDILASAKSTLIGIYKNRNVTDSSYKKLAFSGVVGAEFVFNYRLGIDARFHTSFTNMRADNGTTPITNNGSVKMNAFETGIFFRFGKKPRRK